MNKWYLLTLLTLGVVLALGSHPRDTRAADELPRGFSRVLVASGLTTPTAMAFLGNRIFVAEKNTGVVRIVRSDGTLRPRPYLKLSVNHSIERGLLGIAIDPNYAINHFVYVYYTTGKRALNYSGSPKNRVSRFQTSKAVGKNETILLDNIPSDTGAHNAGDIQFGFDGKLYISVGDGGRYHYRALSITNLRGKILRINPDGTIPIDNPFYTVSHAKKSIYAYGFRNPFRFSLRPLNQSIIVADVGEYTWEEIDSLRRGGNYGWNKYEGPCPATTPRCDPAQTDFGSTVPPIHFYGHHTGTETGYAVVGGAFATNSNYPSIYNGAYFYGDYYGDFQGNEGAGWVHVLVLDLNNAVITRRDFDLFHSPVDFATGPDGNIYVVSLGQGAIYKYIYLL